jgi:hypothetical protein
MTTPFAQLPHLLIAAGFVSFLPSCEQRHDPGLLEKAALLEAELRDREQQLAAMREEVDAASQVAAQPGIEAPDLDAARGGYLTFVEDLKAKLAGGMPGVTFDRTSVFPVEGPDPSRPIISQVTYRVVDKDGRSGEIDIPLFADSSGTWQEPDAGKIAEAYKTKLAAATAARNTAAAAAPQPAAPPRPQPTDVMGANRTVEIQWGDQQPQGNPNTAPPPQPAPQTQAQPAPALPKKVMPTSRDVIIDFE